MSTGKDQLGAYGFRLSGLPAAGQWMQPQPGDAPALRVVARQAAPDHRRSQLDSDAADLLLVGGARLVAHRGRSVVRYALPVLPSDADLLHPYLAAGAALMWQWRGNEALHAGVLATRAGAVLLLGDKESGKSTTLAWLARHRAVPVLADDLAVIADGQVLAGPRCIDLRANGTGARATASGEQEVDAVSESGGSVPVRNGERIRLSLPAAPSALTPAGTAVLAWGDALKVTPMAPSERLPMLARNRTYPPLQADELALLDLAALPMLMLVRPRTPEILPATADALLDFFG